MNIREYLNSIVTAKEKRAAELRELIKKAGTADEVRALGETLQAVLDELNEAKMQLDEMDDDGGEGEENGSDGGNAGEGRSMNPLRDFRQVASYSNQRSQDNDPTNTVEYRTAFMNFVCRGVPIPMELRADSVTTTVDAAAAIPATVLGEIVKEMKGYGEIYQRVRKLNVQGGVSIPILSIKPTANWVGEGTHNDAQKLDAKNSVIFSYYGLECKIAQSLLVNVTTLDAFQREFATLAAEAIVQALEVGVINGDGSGKMLGILNDTRIPSANKITISAEDFTTWSGWKKAVFAKMKKAYRKGTFIMAQGTFDGYIDGMVDLQGQPIGRVNYGITEGETYRFGGKEVITTEVDVLPDYDSADTGAVVAIFVNLSDYAINSNMQMEVVKWTDHDNNQVKNKVMLVCDGKLVDPNGVLLIKKGAASA